MLPTPEPVFETGGGNGVSPCALADAATTRTDNPALSASNVSLIEPSLLWPSLIRPSLILKDLSERLPFGLDRCRALNDAEVSTKKMQGKTHSTASEARCVPDCLLDRR